MILLPIEIKARELRSRVFLASEAAMRGIPAVVGTKAAVDRFLANIGKCNCIYVAKGGRPAEQYQNVWPLVDRYFVIDEEFSPVTPYPGLLARARYRDDEMKYIDAIFVPSSEFLTEVRTEWPEYADKFVFAGWHRTAANKAEVFRLAGRAQKAVNDAIFFASSFGAKAVRELAQMKNDLRPGSELEYQLGDLDLADPRHRLFSFLNFLNRFQDVNPRRWEIRAHPSESLSDWRLLIDRLPNIRLVTGGSLESWLLRAPVIFHPGSTVALQARDVGIKSIMLKPFASPWMLDRFTRMEECVLDSDRGADAFKDDIVRMNVREMVVGPQKTPQAAADALVDEMLRNFLSPENVGFRASTLRSSRLVNTAWCLKKRVESCIGGDDRLSMKVPAGISRRDVTQVLGRFKRDFLSVEQILPNLVLLHAKN